MQARESEFSVAHQEQTDLKPYPAEESKEDKVQYPTLGKPKHTQAQKDPEPEDENVVQYPTIGRAKPKVSFQLCACSSSHSDSTLLSTIKLIQLHVYAYGLCRHALRSDSTRHEGLL